MLAHYTALLALRRSEIVPLVDGVSGRDASFTTIGSGGVHATWKVRGKALHLDANLTAQPLDGFQKFAPGRLIYGAAEYGHGTAPAWSVRWSIA
jgi:hypothetical protein